MGPAGEGCSCICSKLLNPPDVSWLSAPTKATPGWPAAPLESTGSSCTHGAHHDAQKFTTTGLPCSCHTRTSSPVAVWIASRGAVFPSSGGLASAARLRPHARESTQKEHKQTTTPLHQTR